MKFTERNTKRNQVLFCHVTEQVDGVWEKHPHSHNGEEKVGEAPV